MIYKTLSIMLWIFFFGCKLAPNSMRSEVQTTSAADLIEISSIRMERQTLAIKGTFSFKLKDSYNCRIDYWVNKPDGIPSPGSPMSLDCPNDGKTKDMIFNLENLQTQGVLNFKIHVWPRSFSFLNSVSMNFIETYDTKKTSDIIISRLNVPRNSTILYRHKLLSERTVDEIKSEIRKTYLKLEHPCEINSNAEPFLFPPDAFFDKTDGSKNSLTEISTDGFAQGKATKNDYSPNFFHIIYQNTDRQQLWKWQFKWMEQEFSFESHPPDSFFDAEVNNINIASIKNRQLASALQRIKILNDTLKIKLQSRKMAEISRIIVEIRDTNDLNSKIQCFFEANQETLEINNQHIKNLKKGIYLVTIKLDSIQILNSQNEKYPPWVINSQDWISFEIIKESSI